jgi:hypothetical protein
MDSKQVTQPILRITIPPTDKTLVGIGKLLGDTVKTERPSLVELTKIISQNSDISQVAACNFSSEFSDDSGVQYRIDIVI